MKLHQKLLLILACIALSWSLFAQNRGRGGHFKAQMYEVMEAEVKIELGLDDAAMDRLRPTLKRYHEETRELKHGHKGGFMHADTDSLSDGEADQLFAEHILHAKSMIAIREKYYPEFKKIIGPQKSIKLFQLEKGFKRKIRQEAKRRRQQD